MQSLSKLIIILVSIICGFTSCGGYGAATPESHEISYIPGECLKSNKLHPLSFDAPSISGAPFLNEKVPFHIYTVSNTPKSLSFPLEMDLDVVKESFSDFIASNYRYYPSDNVFKAFGDSSFMVEEGYEKAYRT